MQLPHFHPTPRNSKSLLARSIAFGWAGAHRTRKTWLLLLFGLALTAISIRAGTKPDVLVLRPDIQPYRDAYRGMFEEIGDQFNVAEFLISRDTKVDEVGWVVESLDPRLVVLMGNYAIRHYRGYLDRSKSYAKRRPVVGLMAILVERQLKNLPNAAGIQYEVQGVTIFTHLRSLVRAPIKRVGVLVRKNQNFFIQGQIPACAREEIELVPYVLPSTAPRMDKHIKYGLRHLIRIEKVDALWILNDSVIVSPEMLQDVWIPVLNRYRKPVVVGVERLLRPPIELGQFAVVPDHYELGVQAAQLVWDISERDWQAADLGFQAPLSVKKLLNRKKMESSIGMNEDVIMEIDLVIE